MIRNMALAVLTLGCLFVCPVLAQDDLLTRARQQFQPIPTSSSGAARQPDLTWEG